ncbi:hypothetical protein SAMN06265365_11016 [Tistlia consotensis]|uniref:Uncharacterized protein n=1 Tax=Tistlia consotensis USBA 355 TaxID=560819 RepID=A0A1Y6BTH4_9PROT|nr:hypothetical protein [Tistlia consotensis]SMF28001.1 hypothetical protein SAMN05428998_109140 [Tistlia consotensis USBA 355]SNR65289.1 hypothetical protein SAMN06265365_11016 [Tistlia consotensis]
MDISQQQARQGVETAPGARFADRRAIAIRSAKGLAVALGTFGAVGTVSALWDNPFVIRMTPAGGWEIGLLAALSVLLGLYTAVRRPACSIRTAGASGVLGFLGVACPICNKVLLLLFGGELLLTYFEPLRIYLAALGVALAALALVREWRSARLTPAPRDPAGIEASASLR